MCIGWSCFFCSARSRGFYGMIQGVGMTRAILVIQRLDLGRRETMFEEIVRRAEVHHWWRPSGGTDAERSASKAKMIVRGAFLVVTVITLIAAVGGSGARLLLLQRRATGTCAPAAPCRYRRASSAAPRRGGHGACGSGFGAPASPTARDQQKHAADRDQVALRAQSRPTAAPGSGGAAAG